MGKPEGQKRLGRPRWQDIIERYFKEVSWMGLDLVYLAQDVDKWQALVNAVINPLFA
jgi:endo-alpha-1,4-polygalactosaminidase (GH114 family)